MRELEAAYVAALDGRRVALDAHLAAPGDAARLTTLQTAEARLAGLHGTAMGLLTVAS